MFLRTVFMIGLLFNFTAAFGHDFDFDSATLQCVVNKSESLFIFGDTNTVVYAPFLKESKALEMSEFSTFICPFCYSFNGKVDGKKYQGVTKGYFENGSRSWKIQLNLKINGKLQPSISCIQPAS